MVNKDAGEYPQIKKKTSGQTGFSTIFFPYCSRSLIIGPRCFRARLVSLPTFVKNHTARLTIGTKLVLGWMAETTYGLVNLGNIPSKTPALIISMVYWMLRSIQSRSRPKAIDNQMRKE